MPALEKQGIWDKLTERAVARSLAFDGFAVIRTAPSSPGIAVAIPSTSARLISVLMSGLPRGMEDSAVSPIDFDRELDIEGITCPVRRKLFHDLRRVWVTTLRSVRAAAAE